MFRLTRSLAVDLEMDYSGQEMVDKAASVDVLGDAVQHQPSGMESTACKVEKV